MVCKIISEAERHFLAATGKKISEEQRIRRIIWAVFGNLNLFDGEVENKNCCEGEMWGTECKKGLKVWIGEEKKVILGTFELIIELMSVFPCGCVHLYDCVITTYLTVTPPTPVVRHFRALVCNDDGPEELCFVLFFQTTPLPAAPRCCVRAVPGLCSRLEQVGQYSEGAHFLC